MKYTGRNLYDDNGILWLVQSGSAVEFIVNARSAGFTVYGDRGICSDPGHRPRYAVVVDGKVTLDTTVNRDEEKITIFSGETQRVSEVRIIHLSEATFGAVGIGGIEFDSDAAEPVRPAEEKPLRIEFIGDSITCAYGVEAASENEPFRTTTENFMKSYAYLAAEKLGAEYSVVAYSGHGIVSGWSTDGNKVGNMLVPPYYENVGSWKEYAKPWDFRKNPSDVIVINLGTNDASYVDKDTERRAPEFIKCYEEFLEKVRRYNPDSFIICTLGIMGANDEYSMIEAAIANYQKNTGDKRITSCQLPTQTADDGYGADWHPSASTQQKNAHIIADKISQVLGIKNDK